MNFKKYAAYYNLLYSEKDYHKEVLYVEGLLKKNAGRKINTVLDLGCGTGKHDNILSEHGHRVTGIDISENMIKIAKINAAKNTEYIVGDVRDIELKQKFDAVISLFHVASYQTTNKDFTNYLKTAYNHLNDNGLFIFDFWYGSGVLRDMPAVRVKRLENERIQITRISEPVMYPDKNLVDVCFEIIIKNKKNSFIETIKETHTMRYWFMPEINYLAEELGFSVLHSYEWLSNKKLAIDSWNGIVILKK